MIAPNRAGKMRPSPALPSRPLVVSPASSRVVSLGQHLIAEKEHHVAPALQIIVEQADFVRSELGNVADEYAIVGRQFALDQGGFGGDLGFNRDLPRIVALRRQGLDQIIGRPAERLARWPAVDAQNANLLPHVNGQKAVIILFQGVAGGADFQGMVARRFKTMNKV